MDGFLCVSESASPVLLRARMRLNAEGKQKEKQQRRLNSTSQSGNRHQLWDRKEVCQAPMKAQRTVPLCFWVSSFHAVDAETLEEIIPEVSFPVIF